MQNQSVGEVKVQYVPCKNLTFEFLAQNMRTYESWWFLLTWDFNIPR